MAKIIRFNRKEPPLSADEYIEMLNSIEILVEEVRPHLLAGVQAILNEMKFCAYFNEKFRRDTSDALREVADNLYAEAQGD